MFILDQSKSYENVAIVFLKQISSIDLLFVRNVPFCSFIEYPLFSQNPRYRSDKVVIKTNKEIEQSSWRESLGMTLCAA